MTRFFKILLFVSATSLLYWILTWMSCIPSGPGTPGEITACVSVWHPIILMVSISTSSVVVAIGHLVENE